MKTIKLTSSCTDAQAKLTRQLLAASKAYYNGETPLMSDAEFDQKLDELKGMEFMNEFMYEGSPTVNVGSSVEVKGLRKVNHEYPALSLDKFKYKDRNDLVDWLHRFDYDKDYGPAIMSWKMDGLTLVLTYDDGKLTSAVTRGDGTVGSDVTHNAIYFVGIPLNISYKEHLVVRGEAFMEYEEFNRINAESDGDSYENPRNLAAATIQMLDPKESKKRRINFKAFELVYPLAEKDTALFFTDDVSWSARFADDRFGFLESLGFDVVEWQSVYADNALSTIEVWKEKLPHLPYPTDGLVFTYNDLYLGEQMGVTSHHPKWSMALKWTDEQVETTLRDIEWSPSRTGLLNPVAVFDPVRLEGTTVSRASLHNVSYIYDKDLRIGDRITVYKANMVIPQVGENLSGNSRNAAVKISTMYKVPERCPVCGEPTSRSCEEPYVLKCLNPDCNAKKLGRFVHFCSREGMNIEGLSEEKLSFLLSERYISEFADLYKLKGRGSADRVLRLDGTWPLDNQPGWDKKSVDNLLAAVERSRKTSFVPFVTALGIPGIGKGQAKVLLKHIEKMMMPKQYPWDFFVDLLGTYDFSEVDGFGSIMNAQIHNWYKENIGDEKKKETIANLVAEVKFTDYFNGERMLDLPLDGKSFVITGSLNRYPNREALVADIEEKGGKVTGSVSKNTSALINNDVESTSGKNKKAKELGIPIVSEDNFITQWMLLSL